MNSARRNAAKRSAKKRTQRAPASENGHAEYLRQQICSAASALFISRGFGGTTMQDIADALQISRPKLYYYFRDKGAILGALVHNVPVEAERRASAALRELVAQPEAALRQMVLLHASLILERQLEFRLLDMSMDHLAAPIQARARRAKRGLLDAFTAVIRHGTERGVFRVVDPSVAAFAVIGMCNWTAAWYQESGRLSAEQIAMALADLAVQMLRSARPSQAPGAAGANESLRLLKEGIAHLEFTLGQNALAAPARNAISAERGG